MKPGEWHRPVHAHTYGTRDALLFVDGLAQRSARRVNKGIRRVVVYRYGPSCSNFRHGYRPSPELLARLTPERRRMVWPQQAHSPGAPY